MEAPELAACRRNVYWLQVGGDKLCDALRQIADGCDDAPAVAKAALNLKLPDDFAADAPEGLAGELEQAVEVHRGHCVNYVSFDFGLADRILTALRRPTTDADGLALLKDIRACRKPPQTIETVHGGAMDLSAAWSISELTALLPRIDAHLGGQEQ